LIATKGIDEIRWNTSNSPEQLRIFEEQLKTETDANMRRDIAFWVGYHQSIIESLPTLKLRLPNRTFDKRLVFHGSCRTAEVLTFGGGHTESDSILYLPVERIAFMSDLLFIGYHPYLADGDPHEWLRSLSQIELLDVKTFVPGHGPVGTADDLALIRQYITELEALAAEVVEAEGSADQAAERAIPLRFKMWRFARFFPTNMRFLHERISKARGVTD
jgi:cyclase